MSLLSTSVWFQFRQSHFIQRILILMLISCGDQRQWQEWCLFILFPINAAKNFQSHHLGQNLDYAGPNWAAEKEVTNSTKHNHRVSQNWILCWLESLATLKKAWNNCEGVLASKSQDVGLAQWWWAGFWGWRAGWSTWGDQNCTLKSRHFFVEHLRWPELCF